MGTTNEALAFLLRQEAKRTQEPTLHVDCMRHLVNVLGDGQPAPADEDDEKLFAELDEADAKEQADPDEDEIAPTTESED